MVEKAKAPASVAAILAGALTAATPAAADTSFQNVADCLAVAVADVAKDSGRPFLGYNGGDSHDSRHMIVFSANPPQYLHAFAFPKGGRVTIVGMTGGASEAFLTAAAYIPNRGLEQSHGHVNKPAPEMQDAARKIMEKTRTCLTQ